MQLLDTLVARAIPWVPRALIHKISRRYIAGDTLAEALVRVQQLNAQGFAVTLDVLGETISTLAQAQATANAYIQVLDAVHAQRLQANISIKPSALGLLLDVQQCEQLALHILDTAALHQNSVCLDMEDASCTQKEIELFGRLRARFGNVGLALQAYLRRTYEDIEPLVREASTLRICKGIYVEDRSHLVQGAWNDRSAINEHFLKHVVRCFEAGSFVAIATHDAALIAHIVERVRRDGIDRSRFEFQMLLGVCEPLRDKLLGMGFNVRIYVPFGKDWYGYSTRRLNENPRIAGHIAKALIGL
ncbi:MULTISPECIES: proline dehydrogenase family protein [Acidovorax]|uniref:proline dehydrogenase n=1 Tax=Acidovorax facilis TaxID=12917 RepID=A0ABV8DJI9_9BURK|nr:MULTISPECIES: proline dehydrogenase family protein [Acidovorax]KQB60389.1 L-proline dehydrogenase [Acidovorax sp. SD340]MBO1010594.1 proline dehydrogenase family protein [Acidovorax sp. SD340]MCO4244099.1 proline dehydrogenase family protein [Acidovorax facilis]